MSDEPFDFVRYFTKVQAMPFWHSMQLGLADFAGVQAGAKVLDLGTGPGRLVEVLRKERGITAVSADADLRMAQTARANYPNQPYIVTAAETLPLAKQVVDAVFAANLLFFLPDPLQTLREMARITRSGGVIAIWNPSEQMNQLAAGNYAAAHDEMNDFEKKHIVNWAGVAENNRRWSADDLATLFEQADLIHFRTKTTLGGLARYATGQIK